MSRTDTGLVTVWDAEAVHEKVTEIRVKGHRKRPVYAVDVSPDGTRIETGSEDLPSACVWFLSTGKRVFDPLKHQAWWAAVKYRHLGETSSSL